MPIASILPRTLVDAYGAIQVTLDGGSTCTVSVRNYKCRNPSFGGTVKAEAFKDELLFASKMKVLSDLPAQRLVDVFTGKGRIGDIALALRLVVRYGVVGTTGDVEGELQKVCDEHIGLDCNGFVGNWASSNGITTFGAQTAPLDIGRAYPDKRKTLKDMQALDVIVWSNHVAVLEDTSVGTDESEVCDVAESFGSIMYRPLIISRTPTPGQFTVLGHGGTAVIFSIGLTS